MTATTHTLVWRDPKQLKKHPLNLKLYGDARNDKLGEALKNGIDNPLLITPDDVVLSGHQRRQWAIIKKWSSVPCIVRHDLTDPLEQEECLIRCNEQRERTLEQKAREFERLKEIESERAAKRVSATQTKSGEKVGDAKAVKPVTPPTKQGDYSKNGKSGDIAAEAVGLSRPTAETAAAVVHAIDEAEAAGDHETAEEIRETLNTKGAKPAARQVKAIQDEKQAAADPAAERDAVIEAAKEFDALIRQIETTCYKAAEALSTGIAGTHLKHNNKLGELKNKLKTAGMVLRDTKPYGECPYCDQKKKNCGVCYGSGYVPRHTYDNAPRKDK